jgi:hypothetical protein
VSCGFVLTHRFYRGWLTFNPAGFFIYKTANIITTKVPSRVISIRRLAERNLSWCLWPFSAEIPGNTILIKLFSPLRGWGWCFSLAPGFASSTGGYWNIATSWPVVRGYSFPPGYICTDCIGAHSLGAVVFRPLGLTKAQRNIVELIAPSRWTSCISGGQSSIGRKRWNV